MKNYNRCAGAGDDVATLVKEVVREERIRHNLFAKQQKKRLADLKKISSAGADKDLAQQEIVRIQNKMRKLGIIDSNNELTKNYK